jgi:hypothetical protein
MIYERLERGKQDCVCWLRQSRNAWKKRLPSVDVKTRQDALLLIERGSERSWRCRRVNAW